MPQTQVYTDIALGVPGAKAALGFQFTYHANGLRAPEGGLKVGSFAWLSATDPETLAAATGTGAPLGFIERNVSYYNPVAMGSEGTLTVPEGEGVLIATGGDYYAKCATAAKAGQKVLVKTADGEISAGDAAATGQVDTGWTVTAGGAAGATIIISKH